MSVFRTDILAGRVALVTGGGTGICRGIAGAFAAHGARVCIVSRKQEVIDEAAAALGAETGAEVLAVAADVRDPAQVATAVERTVERFGKLDTLVNGAAGNFLAPAASLSPNAFRTVVEIDLIGSFHCARAAFEPLRDSGDGCMLNISATLQYHGTPLQLHASAAKAGVDAMTRNLAVEWGSAGIRVNAIAPGPIGDTEGMRRLAPGGIAEQVAKHIPLGRLGTVEDVAQMAVYLTSPAASYVTGAIVVVDGGHWLSVPMPGL